MVTLPPEECPRGVPQAGTPRHHSLEVWGPGGFPSGPVQDFSLLATEDEGATDLYRGAV